MGANGFLSQKIAAWVLAYDSSTLSDDLAASARNCILDNLAAALAGHALLPASAAREVATRTFGAGEARIWFGRSALCAAGAAWANSVAASSCDLDDGHRHARGHPGSAIIPAVLAHMAARPKSDREVLAAIALGYEIAVRMAAAQQHHKIQTHQSGRWAGFGVAAACARLLDLDRDQLANALAISGVWAPNQLANGSSGFAQNTGNWAKEGIPVATLQAMLAIDLARLGFSGPLDIFDHQSHYAADALVLSDQPGAILSIYFKRYACCRYVHPVLDAWQALLGDAIVDADQIARIEVSTFSWAMNLSNTLQPQSLVDMQFSVPFCLATRIIYGSAALIVPSDDLLHDTRIIDLAGKIHLVVDPAFDDRFPAETLAGLRVETRSGVQFHSGGGIAPKAMSRNDLIEKFAFVASGRLPDHNTRKILDVLSGDEIELSALVDVL